MSKEINIKNVPKLRFPEFENEGEWIEDTLGSAARFINGRAYKQEELLDKGKYQVLRVGNFFTNNNWYYSDLELEDDKYCDYGDLLYAWSASFGPRIWRGKKAIYHYHIWKVEQFEHIDKNFLFILLDYETERMKSRSANGFALLHITKNTIENWKCYFPNSKIEQQSIAACLSSLDDLITAENQKLDTLKVHKKALMQQLFPADGEPTPKLRFKEFYKSGDWVQEPFSDLYSFLVTNSFSRDNLNFETGSVKNIHYGDIHTKFSLLFDIRQERVPYINPEIIITNIKSECYCIEGDMIFADASEDLQDVGKSIEIVFLNDEKLLSGMHTLMARQKESKLAVGFGGHLFMSKSIRVQIQKEAQGAKVLGISTGRLGGINICYPESKKEQNKIADSLSSLDWLVKMQTEKIESLKLHKKGLTQRLFPNFNY